VCKKKFRYSFLVFFISSQFFFSQRGNYFVQNYTPKDYQAHANNFGVTQSDDGLIFVANDNGVLIFDGINWTHCKREDELTITCIEKNINGEIVVGAKDGDIAKIEKDEKGKFVYRSLLEKIPENERPREIIRQILNIGNATYFLSADKLTEYKEGKLQFYKPEQIFHTRAFILGGHLYVNDAGEGIKVLKDGKLLKVPGSEDLSHEKYYGFYPLTDSTGAIAFRNIGFVIATVNAPKPELCTFRNYATAADNEIIGSEINNSFILRNGNLIVTTNKSGAFELDKKLNLVHRFDTRTGVSDDNIKSAYQDVNGNLWLATYYGLSHIEINSRLFTYNRTNGIAGLVQSAIFFDNKLFIATDKGVQVYDSLQGKFQSFGNFNKQTWNLLTCGDKLFLCTAKGLFVYIKGKITQLTETETRSIYHDVYDSHVCYAGTENEIKIFELSDNSVRLVRSFPVISPIRSVSGDLYGNIYFATVDHGIYYLNGTNANHLDSLGKNEGLPREENENYVFKYRAKILLGTDSGVYRVVKNMNGRMSCVKDPVFWRLTKGSQIFRAAEVDENLICTQKFQNKTTNVVEERTLYFDKTNNKYKLNSALLNKLNGATLNLIFYDSIRKTVILCANEGLYLLNNNDVSHVKVFNLVLRELDAGEETLLENLAVSKQDVECVIPYSNNDLRLTLGYTCYETRDLEFCYMLEGRDKNFSRWNSTPRITFDDLREGNYVLHVKGRTRMENQTHKLVIRLKILPPWYRTVWAYFAYLLLFVLLIYVIVTLNSRRLTRLNKKLERTIAERTRTISVQKTEIEHKQKEIIDSINYAQRIQRALLASDELLKKKLGKVSIFYRPKDIVSGDFYWATELDNGNFCLVTADSTGHGVPGAIMSMLNISCLEKACEAQKLTSADEILNYTRTRIIETLSNDGSEEGGKDGMDCSIVIFDFKNRHLEIAAANNPVWILRRDNSSEFALNEIKPDKMPAGKHVKQHIPFSIQKIPFQKGDIIYTMTDGYADQFGGEEEKKFLSKNLRALLLKIAHLELVEQRDILQRNFEEWSFGHEQVDDVTLIAVQI
jgi:serine phosphatase RsbU (regulator of sigma subunit)/ligand-binding sensor domain-containing protein